MKCITIQGVVLSLAVLIYILVGAGVFHRLESREEEDNRNLAVELLKGFLDNNTCLDRDELLKFVADVIELKAKGVTLSNGTTSSATNWNYPNCIFFALTVVTTIGYGNIAPTNDASRAFSLVFAIIGIPLYLVFLSKIGVRIAELTSYLVERCWSNKGPKSKFALRLVLLVLIGSVIVVFLPSLLFMYYDQWSYFISFYASIITLSTIGFGDYVPGASLAPSMVWVRIFHALWIAVGLAWFSSIISTIQDIMSDHVDNLKIGKLNENQDDQLKKEKPHGTSSNGNGVKSHEPGDSEWMSNEDVQVAHL